MGNIKKYHPNLELDQRLFDNFASSRNYSIFNVETEYILILDVDERLLKKDFEMLSEKMESETIRYNLVILYIHTDLTEVGEGLNPIIFKNYKDIKFVNTENMCCEYPSINKNKLKREDDIESLQISIKHFCPSVEATKKKDNDWYNQIIKKGKNISPSKIESFNEWKAYNPQRGEEFYK